MIAASFSALLLIHDTSRCPLAEYLVLIVFDMVACRRRLSANLAPVIVSVSFVRAIRLPGGSPVRPTHIHSVSVHALITQGTDTPVYSCHMALIDSGSLSAPLTHVLINDSCGSHAKSCRLLLVVILMTRSPYYSMMVRCVILYQGLVSHLHLVVLVARGELVVPLLCGRGSSDDHFRIVRAIHHFVTACAAII